MVSMTTVFSWISRKPRAAWIQPRCGRGCEATSDPAASMRQSWSRSVGACGRLGASDWAIGGQGPMSPVHSVNFSNLCVSPSFVGRQAHGTRSASCCDICVAQVRISGSDAAPSLANTANFNIRTPLNEIIFTTHAIQSRFKLLGKNLVTSQEPTCQPSTFSMKWKRGMTICAFLRRADRAK